ncbi:hypothetical protein GCM10009117_00230 [Gangjinia marincola]|uniref:DNA topoisomerase n=1 Tax=Gangjinia marincola TaxID=578463 RepID=A0ABP3XRD6_9FLAO
MNANELLSSLKNPRQTAKVADLVYVNDHHLSILRKPHGRGFTYLMGKERVKENKTIDRIKSLVIPPNWKNVKIAKPENGHLQAVGRDDKNRKVYRYHDLWMKIRNETKFFKMAAFGNVLPALRKQVEIDLAQPGMPRTKVLALVLKLMEETHVRVGNDYYARRNKTYGLSTLRSKHVDIYKDKMKFNFIGKRGKEHNITIRNKRLIKLVNQCEEIPGWELFKYYDQDGDKSTIDSTMVNEYIQELSGNFFSAKDFRTWAASKIFFETLKELAPPEDEKEQDKNLLHGFDASAKALGNTRNVCRTYYVHPILVEKYKDKTLYPYFEKADELKDKPFFTATEQVVQELYGSYEIDL